MINKNQFLIFLCSCFVFCFTNIKSQYPQGLVSTAQFLNLADLTPYIEVNMKINGNSIHYKQIKKNKYRGTIEITYIFTQNDSIALYKKFQIYSPIISDTISELIDFVDVQRIPISNGDYQFSVYLRDVLLSDSTQFLIYSEPLQINLEQKTFVFSSIEFLYDIKKDNTSTKGNLSKYGYIMIPDVSNFFSKENNSMKFFMEMYSSNLLFGDSVPYTIKYYITKYEDTIPYIDLVAYKRFYAKPINVLIVNMDISKIPTGNYELHIEAWDRNNIKYNSRKVFFQRLNNETFNEKYLQHLSENEMKFYRYQNIDSLKLLIQCLRPIASPNEKIYIDKSMKKSSIVDLQKFMYFFWYSRNNEDPKSEWNKYLNKIKVVRNDFKSYKTDGCATDRGEIYLKYGQPQSIVTKEQEPSNYPYQIWHYYKHPRRSDARYIFYNRNLISNDYTLLHSNVRGELNNSRWKIELQRRNTPFGNTDNEDVIDSYGNEVEELFSTPR